VYNRSYIDVRGIRARSESEGVWAAQGSESTCRCEARYECRGGMQRAVAGACEDENKVRMSEPQKKSPGAGSGLGAEEGGARWARGRLTARRLVIELESAVARGEAEACARTVLDG
jgi:hypothetical protein